MALPKGAPSAAGPALHQGDRPGPLGLGWAAGDTPSGTWPSGGSSLASLGTLPWRPGRQRPPFTSIGIRAWVRGRGRKTPGGCIQVAPDARALGLDPGAPGACSPGPSGGKSIPGVIPKGGWAGGTDGQPRPPIGAGALEAPGALLKPPLRLTAAGLDPGSQRRPPRGGVPPGPKGEPRPRHMRGKGPVRGMSRGGPPKRGRVAGALPDGP